MNKSHILNVCNEILQNKLSEVELALEDANRSLQDDIKSSAGDKYETSREMIQQDLDRYQKQLSQLAAEREILSRIDVSDDHKIAALGKLIRTEAVLYFLCIGLGQIRVEDKTLFVISPNSPIGQLLVGKKEGESIVFREKKQTILEVI